MSDLRRQTWTLPVNKVQERYGWAVVSAAGAVELRAVAGPGDLAQNRRTVSVRGVAYEPDGVAFHSTTPREGWSPPVGVCQVHGGDCWADVQYLPADGLIADWARHGGDDSVIWHRLEAFHAEMFG